MKSLDDRINNLTNRNNIANYDFGKNNFTISDNTEKDIPLNFNISDKTKVSFAYKVVGNKGSSQTIMKSELIGNFSFNVSFSSRNIYLIRQNNKIKVKSYVDGINGYSFHIDGFVIVYDN